MLLVTINLRDLRVSEYLFAGYENTYFDPYENRYLDSMKVPILIPSGYLFSYPQGRYSDTRTAIALKRGLHHSPVGDRAKGAGRGLFFPECSVWKC